MQGCTGVVVTRRPHFFFHSSYVSSIGQPMGGNASYLPLSLQLSEERGLLPRLFSRGMVWGQTPWVKGAMFCGSNGTIMEYVTVMV